MQSSYINVALLQTTQAHVFPDILSLFSTLISTIYDFKMYSAVLPQQQTFFTIYSKVLWRIQV